MAQAFLTYDEQLDKLQTEKELSIPDLSYAKNILQQISYYSLIDGIQRIIQATSFRKILLRCDF